MQTQRVDPPNLKRSCMRKHAYQRSRVTPAPDAPSPQPCAGARGRSYPDLCASLSPTPPVSPLLSTPPPSVCTISLQRSPGRDRKPERKPKEWHLSTITCPHLDPQVYAPLGRPVSPGQESPIPGAVVIGEEGRAYIKP